MKRPRINITPLERTARVVIGGAVAVGGAVLLPQAVGGFTTVLEVLLVLVGLDLFVTGAIGFCPLYKLLGHVPEQLQRST